MVFQESKPWTAIQMVLANWEGEAVGMPGMGRSESQTLALDGAARALLPWSRCYEV